MAQTKIKAGLFEGIIGNGTDGYFLMSNGDGTMTWSSIIINPAITSIAYPGSVTAADPAGGETITVTGTGFKTGATVTIGGTAAPAVSYVSETQITFTTPAKAAGDYDIVVTNTDTGSATYINGISYNGIPTWTTAAGSLGTFASDTTISTITLQATEPDAGTITFSITNGALPTGLSLTGANIDGTTTLETADTLYTFTVTATDDESQATPRTFTITVTKQFIGTDNFTINTYTGNGSTQSIEGKIGTAADFNGSSSVINIPSISPAAVSYFAYLGSSLDATIGHNSNTSNYIYHRSTQIDLGSTIFSYTRTNNNWNHYLITEDGSNLKLYVDGVLTDTQAGSLADYTTIGGRTAGTSQWLDGKMDQVRFFNRTITSSEAATLAAESNTSATKSKTDIFNDGSGIALYEFEEGAKDSNIADYGTGNIDSGQSAVFNGSSYIQAAADYSSSIGDITVSGWYNFSNTNDGWVGSNSGSIFSLGQSNSGQTSSGSSLNIRIAENSNTVGLNSTNNDTNITMTDSFPARNIWFHFVLTYNATTDKWNAYLNGKWQGESIAKTYSFSTTALRLGGGIQNGGVFHFQGKIDKFRIYTRVLNESEIKNLTAENNVSSTDLSNLYEFSGNANDSVGTNNGTWSGTATYSTAAQFPGIISGYDGTPTNVSFVGTSFEPDFVWLKSRSFGDNHYLQDSIRGATRRMYSNLNVAEYAPDANRFTSFDTNGFTVGSDNSTNQSGQTFVAWCWKAGGTAVSNTDGSITSSVSANPDAGFSIVSYTGNSVQGATVGHGLSSAPELIIAKSRSTSNSSWRVGATPIGWQYYMNLDMNSQANVASSIWNSTTPTSSVFSLGNNADANGNGETKIAYCFHSVDGYQKVGSYTGNGGTLNVTTGFEPRFVMLKPSSLADNWMIYDNQRGKDIVLFPNLANADTTYTGRFSFLSDGFQLSTSNSGWNGSGSTYIYLAIA